MNIPVLVFNDATGQYIAGIEAQRGQVSVARHIHDLSELLGVAQTGIARAALIVSGTEQLNATSIASLIQSGVAVVVLRDPGEEIQLGVEDVISSLSTIDEIIECIETSVEEVAHKQFTATQNTISLEPQAPAPKEEAEPTIDRRGKIIAFWGSGGAPGRSTLAVQTAGYLANNRHKVCLIDADTYAPSVSGILGIADDYSAISQLAHFAEKGDLDQQNFLTTTSCIKHGKSSFDVVTGISKAERWAEIRQTAFEKILEVAASLYDFVLVDINHLIEFDEELSFDTIAPLRNGCALTALEKAQHICAVGTADPIGIPRLLKALELLDSQNLILQDGVAVHPWINKVRTSSVGDKPELQIENAWDRYGGKYTIAGFILWDPEVFDKALLTGQTIFELNKTHKINESIAKLASVFASEQSTETAGSEREKPESSPAVIVQRSRSGNKESWLRRKFFVDKQAQAR